MNALEFPPVSHLIEWPDIFLKGSPLAVNKIVLLTWLAVAMVFFFFRAASRKAQLVPAGVQNVAESVVEFVREGVILQTMGPEGMSFLPFLTMLFSFVFALNIFEVIPGIQMPVNARMAMPAFMAILVWVIFNYVGIAKQGLGGYFKSMLFPPGVPKALYILVTP
ncbi:MAG: FoF1 ATP synthase subunit A, partial [Acidimicrobiales bacterium]